MHTPPRTRVIYSSRDLSWHERSAREVPGLAARHVLGTNWMGSSQIHWLNCNRVDQVMSLSPWQAVCARCALGPDHIVEWSGCFRRFTVEGRSIFLFFNRGLHYDIKQTLINKIKQDLTNRIWTVFSQTSPSTHTHARWESFSAYLADPPFKFCALGDILAENVDSIHNLFIDYIPRRPNFWIELHGHAFISYKLQ